MRKRFALLTTTLAACAALAFASDDVRAEFHQTYPLTANGRVAVHNVNGAIQVSAWDRNEVKVDALKRGRTQQDLDDAKIVVDASAGSVDIRTKYPEQGTKREAATIDYTITVPRGASLDSIESVNGGIQIDGVAGAIKASSVNGHVELQRATGDVNASTVNGRVQAGFDRLAAQHVSLSAVNGTVSLALPQDAGVRLKASTVHGKISSDFDLPVRQIGFNPGSSLESTIGNGAAEVKLSTVNGSIELKRR
jgi:DUF4097 and DUF4098 domain-containing protein YvlB